MLLKVCSVGRQDKFLPLWDDKVSLECYCTALYCITLKLQSRSGTGGYPLWRWQTGQQVHGALGQLRVRGGQRCRWGPQGHGLLNHLVERLGDELRRQLPEVVLQDA